MEAGRDEGTIAAAVVGTHTGHGHHLVVQVVGVLYVCSRRGFLVVAGQVVVVQRESCRQVVLLGQVGLEQQLCVGVLLVHAVVLVAVVGIQLVQRHVTHHGDVRAVLGVYDEGVLHVALVAVGLDAYFI